MWSALLVVCALLAVPNVRADTDADDDEITDLPGLPAAVNFKHYSGFLQASATHFLHYWFVQSQNNPVTDPLIFWFNGGPGCSSLDGLLNEMGPYVSNPDGKTLRMNPNAWNQFASVVYMEAPAGVGYSYSTDGNTTTNDDQTSTENYEAVKQFFKKFPSFRNHTLFIMGESYGGVYVPTLTARIVDGLKAYPLNLKGMALGNGYVNAKLNIDTSIRFAYGHGLLDQKVWNTLEKECCGGCADTCDFASVTGDHCVQLVQDTFQFMWYGGLNPYDVFRNCDPNPEVNGNRMLALLKGVAGISLPPDEFTDIAYDETNAFIKNNQPILYGDAPCLNDSDVIIYMNSEAVKRALHIPPGIDKWDICSNTVTRTYVKQYDDMAPFVKKIINANVRVLLYYGDTDMACNFMMGQIFADQLGVPRQLNKTPWKFNKQIAGFKTMYGHARRQDLIFITVKGAGHMAPQWRAEPMQYAIKQFINNHPI